MVAKMRKDYFYICICDVENKTKVVAEKKTGYSVGEIGLHKSRNHRYGVDIWVATHIPTGLKLTSPESDYEGVNRTRQRALKEARERLDRLGEGIEKHMKTKEYEAFRKSRHEQTVSTMHGKKISEMLGGG